MPLWLTLMYYLVHLLALYRDSRTRPAVQRHIAGKVRGYYEGSRAQLLSRFGINPYPEPQPEPEPEPIVLPPYYEPGAENYTEQLPVDPFEVILDHLGGDVRTLLNCSLVCRSWLSVISPRLFRRFKYAVKTDVSMWSGEHSIRHPERTFEAFLDLLQGSERIPALLEDLTIHNNVYDLPIPTLEGILKALPRLRSLKFQTGVSEIGSLEGSGLERVKKEETLEQLIIARIQSPLHLQAILYSFTNITDLQLIGNIDMEEGDTHTLSEPILPVNKVRVKALTVACRALTPGYTRVLNQIIDPEFLEHVRVTMRQKSPKEAQFISGLLAGAAADVETYRCDVGSWASYDRDLSPLSCFSRLRDVHYTMELLTFMENSWPIIMDSISTAPPTLRTVHIDVLIISMHSREDVLRALTVLDWKLTEQVIDQRPALKTFLVQIYVNEGDPSWLYDSVDLEGPSSAIHDLSVHAKSVLRVEYAGPHIYRKSGFFAHPVVPVQE